MPSTYSITTRVILPISWGCSHNLGCLSRIRTSVSWFRARRPTTRRKGIVAAYHRSRTMTHSRGGLGRHKVIFAMVYPVGVEPTTSGTSRQRSTVELQTRDLSLLPGVYTGCPSAVRLVHYVAGERSHRGHNGCLIS